MGSDGVPRRHLGEPDASPVITSVTFRRPLDEPPKRLPDSSSTTSPAVACRDCEMTHGTRSGYNNGCRCRSCTEANTAASRARRQRIAGRSASTPTPQPSHHLVPEAPPGLVSHRSAVSRPRAGSPRRTGDDQNTGGSDWDRYAQLLRLYLAGVGQSPSLLALKDETDTYYVTAGEYGP